MVPQPAEAYMVEPTRLRNRKMPTQSEALVYHLGAQNSDQRYSLTVRDNGQLVGELKVPALPIPRAGAVSTPP